MRLSLFFCAAMITVMLKLAAAAAADEGVHEVEWRDLLPASRMSIEDPIAALSSAQRTNLGLIMLMSSLEREGTLRPADAEKKRELIAAFAAQGIDVDQLLAERERIERLEARQGEAGAAIDGETIRIPGYMLPLEMANQRLTEFLLVPWVGACIHAPTPPPNQIIRVTLPEGMPPRDRFSPAWIEGRIEYRLETHELFLVDGRRDVRVAYTMAATAITDYSAAESDALARVDVPMKLTADHGWWQGLQIKISQVFTRAMTDIGEQRSLSAMIFGLAVAFLYGVLHTIGPGHGKAVIISYFVGEGGSLRRGVGMGIRIALFHVLSAVIVAVLADFAIRQTTGHAPSDYRAIRLASYAAIAAIGIWMLIGAIRALRNLPSAEAGTAAAGTDHNHHHHHGCGCGHVHHQQTKGVAGLLSLAVGAVPCTGALLVLLYGLANDLLWFSIVMVAAISLGMAITLSAIGMVAILGRRGIDRQLGGKAHQRERVAVGLRFAGAATVALVGGGMFMLAANTSDPTSPVPTAAAQGPSPAAMAVPMDTASFPSDPERITPPAR